MGFIDSSIYQGALRTVKRIRPTQIEIDPAITALSPLARSALKRSGYRMNPSSRSRRTASRISRLLRR